MTSIDYQQAAIQAGAKALADDWNPDRDPVLTAMFSDYSATALTAATPHLRAAWEQPIRELHRPVHAVFSWADGPHYEEPCETCYGAPGVHECGCWADTQLEYVCVECHRLGSGSKGVYNCTYPCPTIALLEGGGRMSLSVGSLFSGYGSLFSGYGGDR